MHISYKASVTPLFLIYIFLNLFLCAGKLSSQMQRWFFWKFICQSVKHALDGDLKGKKESAFYT